MGRYWKPLGDYDLSESKVKTSTVYDTGVDRIIGFRNKEETNDVSDEFREKIDKLFSETGDKNCD
jgi:hypothetical protein